MNLLNPVFIIKIITIVFMFSWGTFERMSAINKGEKYVNTNPKDRKSLAVFYKAIMIAYCFGIPVSFFSFGSLSSFLFVPFSGLVLMAGGLLIRLIAIKTLSEQFTYSVKIVDNHKLVTSGLYKYIRHPSYLGQAVIFLGCGMAFSNWISILLLFVPVVIATHYRISVEEEVLSTHFSDQYRDYAGKTKKLIPWVY